MKDKAKVKAIAFLCAAVILSVAVGGSASVAKKYSSASDKYYAMTDGVSAESAVRSVMANAENLITVADRNLSSSDVSRRLEESIAHAEKADIPDIKSAVIEVADNAYLLYKELGEATLGDSDETYRTELFYNIKAAYSVLCHSEYNTYAAEYNGLARRFPAKLFAGLTGKKNLPVFAADDIVSEEKK